MAKHIAFILFLIITETGYSQIDQAPAPAFTGYRYYEPMTALLVHLETHMGFEISKVTFSDTLHILEMKYQKEEPIRVEFYVEDGLIIKECGVTGQKNSILILTETFWKIFRIDQAKTSYHQTDKLEYLEMDENTALIKIRPVLY